MRMKCEYRASRLGPCVNPARSGMVAVAAAFLAMSALCGEAAAATTEDAVVAGRRLLPAVLAGEVEFADDSMCRTRVKPEHVPIVRDRQQRGGYDRPPGIPPGGVAGAPSFTVPLSIHVIRRANGTGGITASQVNQTIADANALWAPSGIQFCQYGATRFLNSDYWFDTTITASLDETLRQIDVVPNTINVYFVPNYVFCGRSSFTFSYVQGIVMKNSCSSGVNPDAIGVFAHELGHYFDLFHTHEPFFGVECTSGANCASAGDLVCDTPADPNLWNKVNLACTYVGNDEPPTGAPCSLFDPPYDPLAMNVMSYTRVPCMSHLTPEQIDRAIATLVNLRPELIGFNWCAMANACGPGTGSCLSSNGSPGCEIGTCCARICVQDAFCCNVSWDGLCANQAAELCLDGNTCELAFPAGDGFASAPGSSYTPSGTASSCSGASAKDVWFAYTATCTGTATASTCGEFTSGNVAISIFDSCEGAELACGDINPACGGGDANAEMNARVSWEATNGQTYLVRVSATSDFSTAFFNPVNFQCEGCGHPDAGSCFSTGTAYCNNLDCCQYVCALDSFCCNVSWDSLCVSQANQFCVAQCGGPITGNCFEPNNTPHCDRENCCNAICAADSFCCNVAWDSLCASAALQHAACEVQTLGGVNLVPLGSVSLNPDPQGNVIISNLSAAGTDGVRADFVGSGLNLVGSSTFKVILPPGLSKVEFVSMNGLLGTNAGIDTKHVAYTNAGTDTWDLTYGSAYSPTYSLSIKPDPDMEEEEIPTFTGLTESLAGTVFGASPGDLTEVRTFMDGGEVFTEFRFAKSIEMLVPGHGSFEGSRIVIGTEFHIIAILIGLEPLAIGPLRDVDVLIALESDESAVLESVEVDTPTGCAGNCGMQSQFLCWCDETCFDLDDCCSDVCEHCASLQSCDACLGDLNGDGEVNVSDLLQLLAAWGTNPGHPADLNGDGQVNVTDLLQLLAVWGPCP